MKTMRMLVVSSMILTSCLGNTAELLISPVNIDIPSGEKSALLTLQNNSEKTIKIHIWSPPVLQGLFRK